MRLNTPGYDKVPDNLILDIEAELIQFQTDTADMRDCEYYIDEVVEEVLMFISDRNYLKEGVEFLEKHIYDTHARDDYREDGKIISKAAATLARNLSQRFAQMGAYMPDGNFPFQVKKWLSPACPVMEKFTDYQP